MSKAKQQGTAWERDVRNILALEGINVTRLAEGGMDDLGDLELPDHGIIVECKDRSQMSLHETLSKANTKAAGGDAVAVVAWKRKVRKGDNKRRTQAGPPLVAMSLSDFIDLLNAVDPNSEWRRAWL